MDQEPSSEALRKHLKDVYPIISAHWIHGEQIRWTLLSNFLMANSILVLAWAAMCNPQRPTIIKVVLAVLCGAGVLLSVLWIGVTRRVKQYVEGYRKHGLQAERILVSDNASMPFGVKKVLSKKEPWSFKTRFVCCSVPVVFLALYIFLGIASVLLLFL